MNSKKLCIIILAAGKGKRMESETPKVLHPLLGKPMIYYVVEAGLHLKPFEIIPVLSHKKKEVETALVENFGYIFNFAHQKEPLGTADAVKSALKHVNPDIDTILILSGDVPLITAEFLEKLINTHKGQITLVSTTIDKPDGYGRVVRDKSGKVQKIVEDKDATPEQKKINEINTGIYCFSKEFLEKYIPKVKKNDISHEYYLTDVIQLAADDGVDIEVLFEVNGEYLFGVNNRVELHQASKILQRRVTEKLMLNGVTIIDADRVYIETTVNIGKDTIIYPDVSISGNTNIGSNSIIEQGCIIASSQIGNNVHLKPYSIVEVSEIHDFATIGPFAHLRPESIIHSKAKIGNFVETKKAIIKEGAKANHLAYIGDALVEENVNIGAGAITCNYDGEKKHFTHIKKGAFIGTNTSLVAPVVVGENAVTGAGSVITKDIPDGALAVERAELRIILDWHKLKKRLKK